MQVPASWSMGGIQAGQGETELSSAWRSVPQACSGCVGLQALTPELHQ